MKSLYSRTDDNGLVALYVYFTPAEIIDALKKAGYVPDGLEVRYQRGISGSGGELYVEMERPAETATGKQK